MNDLVRTAQTNLKARGLYLGQLDGLPGPMTCYALMQVLAGSAAPPGKVLYEALPATWWLAPQAINTFLANVWAECKFQVLAENLSYSADAILKAWPSRFPTATDALAYAHNPPALAEEVYGGRLGNTLPGDGFKYRGRGWPQLTGRDNYALFSPPGTDLLVNPDALLDVTVSAQVAVTFAVRRVGWDLLRSGDMASARKAWNGGSNGLLVATQAYHDLQTAWGFQR